MAKLEFISDADLKSAVEFLLNKASNSLKAVERDFHKNVIDPFATLFEVSGFNLTNEEWIKNEKTRQAQKTLQNHIGEFHQKILGCVAGWKDLNNENGVDIVSEEREIIAEIKNKHNTLSGGKLKDLYQELHELVMPKSSTYKNYKAYYVQIIPKKPVRFDTPFVPPDRSTGSKKQENQLIRTIDGFSFYALVTKVDDALEKLYSVIPEVICEINNPDSRQLLDIDFFNKYFNMAFLGGK